MMSLSVFDFENVDFNVGKLALWRVRSHDTFGGTWLNDYLTLLIRPPISREYFIDNNAFVRDLLFCYDLCTFNNLSSNYIIMSNFNKNFVFF